MMVLSICFGGSILQESPYVNNEFLDLFTTTWARGCKYCNWSGGISLVSGSCDEVERSSILFRSLQFSRVLTALMNPQRF